MNNYYVLIYLINELKESILGSKFLFAISPHKDVLECYIESKDSTKRLIFSTKAGEITLFLDAYRPPKKRNVLEFFKPLEGQEIVKVTLAKYDRFVSIHFSKGRRLTFKLFGHSANALLLKDEKIHDAFKHPERIKGATPPTPSSPTFAREVSSKAKPKNQLTKLNPLLPRKLLPFLIEQHRVGEMSPEGVKAFSQRITDALLHNAQPRVLSSGEVCLWPARLLNQPAEKSFQTVNNCIRFAYRNAVHLRRIHQKRQRIRQVLQRTFKKQKARYRQLKQSHKSLERADKYEKWGHLLMAHAHETLSAGAESLEVKDFYQDDEPIRISLKSGISIADNAQKYYQKAQSARTAYTKAQQQLPELKEQKQETEQLIGALEAIERFPALEKWIKQHRSSLEKRGYGTRNEGQAQSPFRKFKVGKYEIWIGKNAKSNDELTSRAHKEDIWLHARGVGGSHTVIRMGNQKAYPPKKVLLHAASYAAYYSKAKGMKTAPVMYTKCKYVRKPKGAAPGAVVVEREEVMMIPPLKPR